MISRLPCVYHVLLGDRKSVERHIWRSLFPKEPISCQERLGYALVEWSLSTQAIDELALFDCDRHIQPQIDGRNDEIPMTAAACGRQDPFCRDIPHCPDTVEVRVL